MSLLRIVGDLFDDNALRQPDSAAHISTGLLVSMEW